MSGSRDVGKVRFAGEAMTPWQRFILGELLRQFFSPVHFCREHDEQWREGETQKSLLPTSVAHVSS